MKTANHFLAFSSLTLMPVRWIGLLALAARLLSSPAEARVLTWSGMSPDGCDAFTGQWNYPANWGGLGSPLSGDTLVFPSGYPWPHNANNIPGLTLNQIRFTGSAGDQTISGWPVTLTNSIIATNTAGTNTIYINIALAATNIPINVGSGAMLRIGKRTWDGCNGGEGILSGTGGLTKLGLGTLVLYPEFHPRNNIMGNIYAGSTIVNEGVLELGGPGGYGTNGAVPGNLIIGDGVGGANADVVRLVTQSEAIADTANVTINSSGLLDLNGSTETVGSLSGSGNMTLGSGGMLVVGGHNTSTTFSGVISGDGTFTKQGAGTMTLTGDNTYTGATTLSGGTLLVNGSQPQSAVTVSTGATLGGSGVVGHISAVDGVVALGTGILTSSNVLFYAYSSSLVVELHGTNAGSGYGQLNVRGDVSMGNGVGLNVLLTFPSAVGNSFTIINNDGSDAVSGTFAGLPEGATLIIGGAQFRISYAGGNGNDVVLTQLTERPRPQLTIAPVSTSSVRLLWPTNPAGFNLEASTNLGNHVWSDILPAPVVLDTNNVVTNTMDTPQKFYRLRNP